MVVGVALVGANDRAFRQVQAHLLEEADVGLRSRRQAKLHRLPSPGSHQMHSQPVEVAAFAHNVAAESLAMLLWGIKLAAADANVVAHGDRQGVHHVSGLLGALALENFGQHIEERSPEGWVYGVQPSVEATLANRLLDVSVLVQKRAARLDVPAEECAGHKSYGHHLGGRQENLRIVTVACGLQELLA